MWFGIPLFSSPPITIPNVTSLLIGCQRPTHALQKVRLNNVLTYVQNVTDNCQQYFRQLSETLLTNVDTSCEWASHSRPIGLRQGFKHALARSGTGLNAPRIGKQTFTIEVNELKESISETTEFIKQSLQIRIFSPQISIISFIKNDCDSSWKCLRIRYYC